jgi:hypothetical protein
MHIGKLIEKEFKKQNRSVTWFARNLFCDRTNVYSIFRRESIDTELLKKVSVILEHNFFEDLCSECENVINNQHNREL